MKVFLSKTEFLAATGGKEDLEPGFTACFTDEVNRAVIKAAQEKLIASGEVVLPSPDKKLVFKDVQVSKIGRDEAFAVVAFNGEPSVE